MRPHLTNEPLEQRSRKSIGITETTASAWPSDEHVERPLHDDATLGAFLTPSRSRFAVDVYSRGTRYEPVDGSAQLR